MTNKTIQNRSEEGRKGLAQALEKNRAATQRLVKDNLSQYVRPQREVVLGWLRSPDQDLKHDDAIFNQFGARAREYQAVGFNPYKALCSIDFPFYLDTISNQRSDLMNPITAADFAANVAEEVLTYRDMDNNALEDNESALRDAQRNLLDSVGEVQKHFLEGTQKGMKIDLLEIMIRSIESERQYREVNKTRKGGK